MKILYLVHDLSDAAVQKRTQMLRDGGAVVTVAGFRRNDTPPQGTVDFGRTYNGGFIQRILAVLRQCLRMGTHKPLFAQSDVVIARNLEMLALAVRGRALCGKEPVLVYESLDIHRLLLNSGPVGKAMRALEGFLANRAKALITSSPAFIREYFDTMARMRLPVRLMENKVYGDAATAPAPRPAGPPWRIGWFGAIRCAKSLQILSELVAESKGAIEVDIRGRPARDVLPDFERLTTQTPGLRFLGPYRNPGDLAAIYGAVHFSWAVDMFEEGLNSSWLLPNRLYEGGLYGAVPIALSTVETGRYLRQLGLGVTMAGPLLPFLRDFFAKLTASGYQALQKTAMEIPASQWRHDESDAKALTVWLQGLESA
jgi:succinoglycan biosynthesis protein ExoL